MTSKERFLAVLNRKIPDRIPVTTHHLMPSFLDRYCGGISNDEFFDLFGFDPIRWLHEVRPNEFSGDYYDPEYTHGTLEGRRIISDAWKITEHTLEHPQYKTVQYDFITPEKTLHMILQGDEHTSWVIDRLVKVKSDIDLIAKYAPRPVCDVKKINQAADEYGMRGMIRGVIPGFQVYGQPGCWQDAAVLFGIENLIFATYDDPEWVHTFLRTLQRMKLDYINSLEGARFDLIELGGGDASCTVISPDIFDTFVAPYDEPLIRRAHEMGQRIVYHTCGGMMSILENIAAMNPDAMETFTPEAMGGDTILHEAKKRIGDKVCMIGGFDQFHFFKGCTPEETRREVRRCFAEAGESGGYILAPSDHFFDAEPELLCAFADEAKKCVYT